MIDQKLHHIGFVVASIADTADRFAASVSGSWDGQITHDPLQGVRVAFIAGASPNDALIELVEPASDNSPVSRFLKRGGGLNHVCYEVDGLEDHLAAGRSLGGLIVRPPMPAVAFGNRRIAWLLTPQGLLVEYLEK